MSDIMAADPAAVNTTSTPTRDAGALREHLTANLPAELRAGCALAPWSPERRDGKVTKPPRRADDPTRYAKSNDSSTWSTFDEALAVVERGDASGIGRMIDGDLIVIDRDDCRDPETGRLTPEAAEIVRLFGSYAEVSPSGRGIHIWVRGRLPVGGRRKGGVEVYDAARFVTLTGNRLPETPATIEERTAELAEWYPSVFGRSDAANDAQPSTPCTEDESLLTTADEALIAQASAAENGEEFRHLWAGERMHHPSDSERDLRLCNFLAYWTNGNAERMARLFRASECRREKCDEHPTYLGDTIAAAIAGWRKTHRAAASTSVDRRFRIYTEADLDALPEPRWLIDGLIAEDSFGMLIGPPATFKSFLALAMAQAIARGQPFACRPTVQGPAVVIAGEGMRGLGKRTRAWRLLNLGPTHAPSPNLYFVEANASLFEQGNVALLTGSLASIQPAFVVVDTLNACFNGADENEAVDVGRIIGYLGEMRRALGGATILMLHHTPRSEPNRERGSTALRGACDFMLVMKRSGDQYAVTLETKKMKDAEHPEPTSFVMQTVEMPGRDGKATTSLVATAAPRIIAEPSPAPDPVLSQQAILDALTAGPLHTNVLWQRCGGDTAKKPTGSFSRARKALHTAGRIQPVTGRSGWWELAPVSSSLAA